MIGNPPPWTDDVELVVEITDGGSIIAPVTPDVVPVLLPQFGAGTVGVTGPNPPAGWAKYDPTGTDADLVYFESAASSRYESVQGEAAGRHGIITSAFYPLTNGHEYRLSVLSNCYKLSGPLITAVVRIESYPAASTTVIGSWETVVVVPYKVGSPDNVVTLNTGPVVAGTATRFRVILASEFIAGTWQSVSFRDPTVYDDPLAPGYPPVEPLTWRVATCDVASTVIRYGREKLTDRFDVGSCVVTLLNVDGDYAFADPHPIGFGPGRLVRVTAIHDDITYPMFFGVIDSIVDAFDIDGDSTVVVTAYDPTSLWASINWRLTYGAGTGAGELTGARINRLLDYIAFPDRVVDTGTVTVQALPAVSGRPLRDEAGITADTEGGAVFAERNGTVVFRDATWRTTEAYAQNVTANITAQSDDEPHVAIDYTTDAADAPVICPTVVVTDWSLRRVINRVALANAGGVTSTFDDWDSQLRHGIRGYQRLDLIGTSDGYLAARGADLLEGYATAKLRVNAVTFRPAAAMTAESWRWSLSVFFNWLVRVWYHHPTHDWGFAVAAFVQGIEHRITPKDWTTTLRLDDPATFVITTPGRFALWADDTDLEPLWDAAVWT